MPIRAYLVLHRTLLFWCSAIAFVVPFATVLFTTSDDGLDFGVFWNHFCGCAPARGDAFSLLYVSFVPALVMGALLSFANRASATNATAATTALGGTMSYTLTRPMRRSAAFLTPILISLPAIAILPVVGSAIIFGWMHLVHAPALAFFPRALRLVPDASVLPPNASFLSLLFAAHAVSIYLGSISIGFLAYALFYTQRWLMLSRNPRVRAVASFQIMSIVLLPWLSDWITPRFGSWFFLMPKHQSLSWHPSALLLLIHFAIPAALLYASWRTLEAADL